MNTTPNIPKLTFKGVRLRYGLLQKLNDLTLEYNNKVREKNISNARAKLDEVFQLTVKDFTGTYHAIMRMTDSELEFKISQLKRELEDFNTSEDTIRSGREDIYAIYEEQKRLYEAKLKEQEKKYQTNADSVA